MTFINYYFTLLKQIDLYYISIINIKSNILTITLAKFHIISSLTHDVMYCFKVFCEVVHTL